MKRQVGVHRVDDADVIDALAELRKNLADFDAAFAELLELERRLHQGAGLTFGLEVSAGIGFAVILGQFRFVVEAIDLGAPAIQEQVDNMLGLRREMRLPGSEWTGMRLSACQQREKPHHAKAGAHRAQQVAAADR